MVTAGLPAPLPRLLPGPAAAAAQPVRLGVRGRGAADGRSRGVLDEHVAGHPATASTTVARRRRDGCAGRRGHGDYRERVYRDGLSRRATDVVDVRGPARLSRRWRWPTSTTPCAPTAGRTASTTPTTSCDLPARARAAIDALYEMLEGQVAVLSSGLLDREEVAGAAAQPARRAPLPRRPAQLHALPRPRAARLPATRTRSPREQVARLRRWSTRWSGAGTARCSCATSTGDYHFNGAFRNAQDVAAALRCGSPADRVTLAAAGRGRDAPAMLDLFEDVFRPPDVHRPLRHLLRLRGPGQHLLAHGLQAAAGRPGELLERAVARGADPPSCEELAAAYYDIRAGLGFNKSAGGLRRLPDRPLLAHPEGPGRHSSRA